MRLTWRREWTLVVGIFLLLRLVASALGAWVASGPAPEPLAGGPVYAAAEALLRTGRLSELLVNVWMRWDTGWFLKIGSLGYDAADGSYAFQPLYPLLSGLLGRALANPLLGALVVSNLAALAALLLLLEVARVEAGGGDHPLGSVLALAVFPTAFFLLAAYTDSIFLALALGAWLSARRGRWLLAGALGALATLTRLQGALLSPVLALAWLEALGAAGETPAGRVRSVWLLLTRRAGLARIRQALRQPAWLGVTLPALAFLGWTAAGRLAGLGTIPAALAAHWGICTVAPWTGVWAMFERLVGQPRVFVDYIDLLALAAILVLLVLGLRRIDPALSLFSWLTLALFFMRGSPPHLLDSFSRYMLAIFPAFLLLGRIRPPLLRVGLAALSFGLQTFLLLGFLDWRWVA